MGTYFSSADETKVIPCSRRKEMSDTNFLLFRLPKALLVRFLSEWLDIHDVGRLDSAMTNKKHRPEFLQCLTEMRNATVQENFDERREDEQKPTVEHDMQMLSWISVRQIHIETLSLESFPSMKEYIGTLHLPSLRKLSVGCPPWLRSVPQLSPLLEELSIGKINKGVTMEDVNFVLSQCLQLKGVRFDSLFFQSTDWTDDVLEDLQEFGHLIVKIRFSSEFRRRVTTTAYLNFLKHCPRLRKLGYSSFEDRGMLLMCVAQSCLLLESIRFDTCSKPALLELCRNCKLLREIEIYQELVSKMSSSEIEILKQIDSLEELRLISCAITNEKLVVISRFRHLKHIDLHELDSVEGLTGAGFRVLEGSPISNTLESISVQLWENFAEYLMVQDFDTAGLLAGIASCNNLRNIDLLHYRLCDNVGLAMLGVGCPLLEEIGLTYGPVTVDGLVALAEHCQHLTKVVLNYDYDEGRDFAFERAVYFDGSCNGPGHTKALAAMPIIRSRLPHIEFECFNNFDTFDDDFLL